MTDRWFDDAAGPVVRPYAMTRGRTKGSVSTAWLDLIALVIADPPAADPAAAHPPTSGAPESGPPESHGPKEPVSSERAATVRSDGAERAGARTVSDEIAELLTDRTFAPEHVEIVRLCRRSPLSVAEIAAELDLPVGVVRVFIGDLMETELVRVSRPVPPAELPDESILREVINGLRAL